MTKAEEAMGRVRGREMVRRLSQYQLLKLSENSHKGGWIDESLEWLLTRLLDEVQELKAEIRAPYRDPELIARECADVANFAGMILDVAMRGSLEKNNNT